VNASSEEPVIRIQGNARRVSRSHLDDSSRLKVAQHEIEEDGVGERIEAVLVEVPVTWISPMREVELCVVLLELSQQLHLPGFIQRDSRHRTLRLAEETSVISPNLFKGWDRRIEMAGPHKLRSQSCLVPRRHDFSEQRHSPRYLNEGLAESHPHTGPKDHASVLSAPRGD
jgi:hypothetical protein